MSPIEGPLLINILSYAGVAVFAAAGALAGAEKKHDVVTFAFFATFAGVGGGTVRDLLLDAPVFWIQTPSFLALCLVMGVAVWLVGYRSWRFPALMWLDAIGLAAFAVLGAEKALRLGAAPLIAVAMGVVSATAGGMIRDLLAHEPSVLLRREIYVTAAALASAVFVAVSQVADPQIAGLLGFAAGFGLRAAAMVFGLSMPGFSGGLSRRLGPPEV